MLVRQGSTKQQKMITRPRSPVTKQNESTDVILNHLISGNGIKKKKFHNII